MKTNLSDQQIKKLAQQLKRGRDRKDSSVLERALKQELEGLSGSELFRRENEIREQWTLATEKTTAKMGGFLEGLLGPQAGKAFAKRFARADDKDVEKASAFFDKYKKDQDKKEGIYAKKSEKASKEFSSLKKAVMSIQKNVLVIRKSLGNKSTPASATAKSEFYFDPRMAGGGRWKETATDKMVSAKDVQLKRGESLGKAIGADEDPMVRIADSMEGILKNLGEMTKNKTIHQKLDDIGDDGEDMVDDAGFSASDLLDNIPGGGRNKRRGRKGGKGGRGGSRGRGGRMGGALGLGGLLAGAAGGYLAYSAVDSMRDPNLIHADPEFLKQQAGLAETPGEKKTVGDQIAAQKRDIKLEAGATAAGVGGAVGGAVVAKKVASTAVVKNAKSKVWSLFVGFVKKKAPSLFAKIGARLAVAGGLATVPFIGWVGTAVTVVGSIWLAYDLFQLWQEFSALSEAEQALYDEKAEKSTGEVGKGAAAPAAAAGAAAGMAIAASTPQTTAPPAQEQGLFSKISGAISSSYQGAKQFLGMGDGSTASQSDLAKYVRLKDSSVDINGLNPQLKTRLAGMSKEYYEQTGKKIQLNSGYRSPEEQAELYAKLGPPKAAPPGRSRHERGLAIDMNSPDANKAAELGLMQKYGFTRPVRGETWHVEPIETAKRGGSPDNPYKPGAPVAVANKGGDVVSPESGKIPQSLGPGASAGTAESSSGAAAVAATPKAQSFTESEVRSETRNEGSAQVTVERSSSTTIGPAPKSDQPTWLSAGMEPDWLKSKQETPDLKPQMSMSGEGLKNQSVAIEDAKMQMQTAPAPVVNNIQAGQSGPPPMIPKSPAPKATTRPQDSSFMRALAKDFAHPTAFTTVSMV
jgi:uncharacterized protein YcbK (DUF882 family)